MADIKFHLNRLAEYTNSSILDEIRRVAALTGTSTLTRKLFLEHSKVSMKPITNRFNSWQEALEEAGLGHLYSGIKITGKMRDQPGHKMSNGEVISEIIKLSKKLKKDWLTVDDLANHPKISPSLLRSRFGSWEAAINQAGLKISNHGKRYDDKDCYENLFKVWTYYRRPPAYKEMNQPPSNVGPKAYIVRWGTWNKALQAFVDYVNEEREPLSQSCESVSVPTVKSRPIKLEDRRDIPLGLRYKIMNRDNFKCVLCGHVQSDGSDYKLHVDHIIPWSKGGKTTIENLRTLCAKCNLGKGAKIEK
ncbi:MAG: HNH endonuclease [Desulfarculaceae bacterium]|nr:HNH endonuclease [Desulfarculaceae bacterium]MCF8045903.1 HNH endonuclease [Desulfarculaceae bacterium]MCF8097941.1 HNH endonuclease [Desulfarculaceae bacterium]MCF8121106.1 HNH endonuclease [Desulfarculaceae bacterium]